MIDSKATPLHASTLPGFSVPIAARTALLFNTAGTAAAALAALLPLGVALYWGLADAADIGRQIAMAPEVTGAFGPVQRLVAALITVLTVLPLSWGLMRLGVCFRQFAQGRPFAPRGIAGLRDFAVGMAVAALAKPVGYTLLMLALTWNAGPGKRQLALALNSDMLLMALFAATIAALAWAMEKAAIVADENSQFV
jgi:hypothetical protein